MKVSNSNKDLVHVILFDDNLEFSPIIAWDFKLGVPSPVIMELQPDNYNYLFAVYDKDSSEWWIDNGSIKGEGKDLLLATFYDFPLEVERIIGVTK